MFLHNEIRDSLHCCNWGIVTTQMITLLKETRHVNDLTINGKLEMVRVERGTIWLFNIAMENHDL